MTKKKFSRTTLPNWLCICFIMLLFVSCDPGQTIFIENNTDADASVTFVFNKGVQAYNFNEDSKSDTLVINLDTTSQNRMWDMQFGLGTWKIESSLDSLISTFNLIELQTSKSKQTYQGEEQIRAFLESRITGGQKQVIQITLE